MQLLFDYWIYYDYFNEFSDGFNEFTDGFNEFSDGFNEFSDDYYSKYLVKIILSSFES